MSLVSTNTTERLAALRSLMSHEKYKVNAFLVFSEDAHQSEYIADSDKRREFISGFSGSAGFAAVTEKDAALWTDGRYYLQASQQLDKNWSLMKSGLPETPSLGEWLGKVLNANSRVGVDPKLISNTQAKTLEENLKKKGHSLVAVNENLVDLVWKDKPAPPKNKAFVHPIKYAGKSHQEKLQQIREELKKFESNALVVSALDEIAWLFNLRGSDIAFNPVFMSYAIISETSATLYIDNNKVDDGVHHHLTKEVEIRPYSAVFEDLKKLNLEKKKVWLDPNKASLALFNCVDSENAVVKSSPISLAKSLKNPAELEGLRQCHLRDAVALMTYLTWLEERVLAGDTTLNECTVADKLDGLRAEQKDFVSLSFETISSSGPNGAIIHYKPDLSTCAKVEKNKLYLVDSGGQYKDGTTDVTRTLHFGEPTEHERRCFTRVLQGVIGVDTVIFPRGTSGREFDILARLSLWKEGLDYRHGTGHGVGAFLNVHEGPQGISFRDTPVKIPFEPGMTITDEPGYYEDGNFGIRIENVLVCVEAKTPHNFGGIGFLGFEHITLVPIQTKMIDTTLLTHKEVEWVNNYHKKCLEKVGPLLSGKPLEWLKKETQPIHKN